MFTGSILHLQIWTEKYCLNYCLKFKKFKTEVRFDDFIMIAICIVI